MKKFAELFTRLDQSNKTTAKLEALSAYFLEAPPEDAAWAVGRLGLRVCHPDSVFPGPLAYLIQEEGGYP